MGWLDHHHRRKMRKKYKVRIFYWCDIGEHPVPPGEPPCYDPNKGFHTVRMVVCGPRGLTTQKRKEPRYTWCLKCNRELLDSVRHKKEHKRRAFLKVVNDVVERIKAKPKRGYWTMGKLIEKLHKHESRLVVRAVKELVNDRTLKLRDDAYLIRKRKGD